MLKSYGLAAPSNGSRTEHSRQDSWVYVGISGHLWTLGISHGLSSLMPLLWSHAGSTPVTRAEGRGGGPLGEQSRQTGGPKCRACPPHSTLQPGCAPSRTGQVKCPILQDAMCADQHPSQKLFHLALPRALLPQGSDPEPRATGAFLLYPCIHFLTTGLVA